MAQLALPLLGAWAAPSLGFAASTGWLVGSVLSSFMGGPRKGRPTIHESGVQTIQEGAPIPIVFGTAPVTGNVIAAGPMRKVETPIKQSKGGSKVVGTEVQYFCTYAVEYAKGEVGGILIAKRDGKIVFDARPGANFDADNAAFLAKCRIYTGTETQMPDPALEAIFGAGEVSAHRGIAYIVFEDHEQTDRGGSLSQWEFVVGRTFVRQEPRYDVQLLINPDTGSTSPIASEDLSQNAYVPAETEGVSRVNGAGLNVSGAGSQSYVYTGMEPPTWDIDQDLAIEGQFYVDLDNPQFQIGFFRAFGFYALIVDEISPDNKYLVLGYDLQPNNGEVSVSAPSVGGYPNYPVEKQAWFTVGIFYTASSKTVQLRVDNGTVISVPSVPFVAGTRTANDFGVCSASQANVLRQGSIRITVGRRRIDKPGYSTPGFPTKMLDDGLAYDWVISGGGEPQRLDYIVQNMHIVTGAEAPVCTELEDVFLDGLTLASPDYTGADVIDMLRSLYMFDRIEKNGQTHYELRGKPVVETITEGDLVDEDEEAQREAPLMFPRKLLLTHINPNANYETSTPPPSTRYSPDVRVQGEQSVSFPVVMDEAEAAKRAAILHKVAWVEAEGEVKFSLPYRWIWLTPGDCVILTARGQSRRVRIDEIEESDFVLKITGRVDRASAYNANPTFIPLVPPEPPVSTVPGDTTLAVLDIPAIVEQDDALVMRLAVVGGSAGWRGAVVQRSLDSGETFTDAASLGASTMGTLVDAISSASEHYTDTTTQVRVQMLRSGLELTAISESAFLGSGGTFALEKPDGTFEVMQYLDAEDEGDGLFLLTTLHRGLLNSKPSAHAVGAKFVLLADTVAVSAQSTWLGQELVHRAPSVGTSPEEADQQTMEFAGRSQLEWPVYLLSLERDTDTITGSWLPRHRFGSDVNPLASVNFTGYRVTLDDGTTVATVDVTDPNFSFDATGMAAPLSVTIAALNRITGPGEAVTEEI